jgi:hypothetical protein
MPKRLFWRANNSGIVVAAHPRVEKFPWTTRASPNRFGNWELAESGSMMTAWQFMWEEKRNFRYIVHPILQDMAILFGDSEEKGELLK